MKILNKLSENSLLFLCGVQVVAMGWAVLREIFPEVVGQSPRVFKAMKQEVKYCRLQA